MKRCPKCGNTKPVEMFARSPKNRDGRHGHCRECSSSATRQAYAVRGKLSWMTESECVRCKRLLPKSMFAHHGRSCSGCLAFEAEQHAKNLKQCNKCQEWLTHDKFQPSKLSTYRTNCRACTNAFQFGRRDKTRAYILMREYGITVEQYDELIHRQGGKCPVCSIPFESDNRSYHVDHAHSGVHEGRIRAIVHGECNRSILRDHDDPAQLRAAADIIENPLTDWYVPGVPYNQRRTTK